MVANGFSAMRILGSTTVWLGSEIKKKNSLLVSRIKTKLIATNIRKLATKKYFLFNSVRCLIILKINKFTKKIKILSINLTLNE